MAPSNLEVEASGKLEAVQMAKAVSSVHIAGNCYSSKGTALFIVQPALARRDRGLSRCYAGRTITFVLTDVRS